MKKGLIGILFCTLLVAASFVTMASAQTVSSEKDSEAEPPQPTGFGTLWIKGGFGATVFGWCLKENWETMTLRWEATKGKLDVRGPWKLKERATNSDQMQFVYFYLIHGVRSEFMLYVDYLDGGHPRTETFKGKVVGGYLVYGLQRI